MKAIIAGPRDFHPTNHDIIRALAHCPFPVWEIVTGGAKGVDTQAKLFAIVNQIPHKVFEADWATHGHKAGPIRNAKMAEYADALIVIRPEGSQTPGTNNMIETAEKRGMKVHIEEVASCVFA